MCVIRLRSLPGSKVLALLVSLEVLRLGWWTGTLGCSQIFCLRPMFCMSFVFCYVGIFVAPKNLNNKTLMSTKSRSKDFSVSLFQLGESLATLAAWAWETQSVNQVHVTMPFWKDLFEIVWLDVSGVQDTLV